MSAGIPAEIGYRGSGGWVNLPTNDDGIPLCLLHGDALVECSDGLWRCEVAAKLEFDLFSRLAEAFGVELEST